MSVLVSATLAADETFDLQKFLLGRFKDEGNDLTSLPAGWQVRVSLENHTDALEQLQASS